MRTAARPLFRYRPGDTLLHRVPVGAKLLAMLGGTAVVFSAPLPALVALSLALPVVALLGRLDPRGILPGIRVLGSWALFIAAFRIIGKPLSADSIYPELRETALYVWRLASVMVIGTAFYETTSGMEIRDAFSDVQAFLNRALEAFHRAIPRKRNGAVPRLPDFAFMVSLTILFIPRIFDTWSGLERAWLARGGNARRGFRGAFAKTATLVPLLVIKLLAVAADMDRAIRNRAE